jgi:hypothetical protein
VRLYRVTKNDPPTEEDMMSYWDLYVERRPQGSGEVSWKEVSTFVTAELAAAKARARNLGEYIAELEVPEDAIASRAPSGHVGVSGLTPHQLLSMVQNIRRVDDV